MTDIIVDLTDGFHRYGKEIEKIFVPNYIFMSILSEMVEKFNWDKSIVRIPDEIEVYGIRVIWTMDDEMKVIFKKAEIKA